MTLQMCEEAAMVAIALQAARCRPEARQAVAFKPVDPDIVSAAIPAFFIGRSGAGLWIAREVNGRVGGLFLFKSSAIDFANRQSAPERCALVLPTEAFELDIENRGNLLIAVTAHVLDGVKRLLRRKAAR